MRKGDIIGGYHILQDFIVAGGMSKISFAKRGDTEYFIKEFLSPRYPISGAPGSPSSIARRQKRCDNFEAHHKKLNDAIGTKCAFGGNLVGTLPLNDFKVFAKVGYHRMETKVKIAGLGSESFKEREWVPSVGLGGAYTLTPELDVIAEYERYKDVADDYNVDFASVGIRYKF